MSISKSILFFVVGVAISVSLAVVQNAYPDETIIGLLGGLSKNNFEKSSDTIDDSNSLEAAGIIPNDLRSASGIPEGIFCLLGSDGTLIRFSFGSYFGTSYSLHGFVDIPVGLPSCNGFSFAPVHGTAILGSSLQSVSLGFDTICVDPPNWVGSHANMNLNLITGIATGYTINNLTGVITMISAALALCPF